MQICDLDDYQSDLHGSQDRIVGGKTPTRAISLGSAAAIGLGDITLTKTLSLTQINTTLYQANSKASSSALSIVSPYRTTSGLLASGRATVSSLGIART
jgi:hypothetical protein